MSELTNFVIESIIDESESLNEYSGGNSIPNDGNATTGKQWNYNWEEYDSEDYYLNGLPDWQFVDKKPSKREQESAVDQKLPIDNQNDGVTTKYNRILKQNFPMPYINEMIKHEGDNWVVYNKNGTKKLGTHTTKKDALKQLRAIEIHKHESIDEDIENDPKIKSITRQMDTLNKKKDSMRDKMTKDYELYKKQINIIDDKLHGLEDQKHNATMTETVLTEGKITKNSIREYYRTIMRVLGIKPLSLRFQFVKTWGINTEYELDTFKPTALIIDPLRIGNEPDKAILHEITHHIKLINSKNPFKGDEDSAPEFIRLQKKIFKKFLKPEYSNILYGDNTILPVKHDKSDEPKKKLPDEQPEPEAKEEPKPVTSVEKEKPEAPKKIKKKKEPDEETNDDDTTPELPDRKIVKNLPKAKKDIKHKHRNQDLTRKIKNPDTGKLIKIKSALRYPKETKAHQAAVLALKRQ